MKKTNEKNARCGANIFDTKLTGSRLCQRRNLLASSASATVSGYAVWYRRYLDDNPLACLPDGDYLLRFFAPQSKHMAIEFAVLASKPEQSAEDATAALDKEARTVMVIQVPEEIKPVFEQIR